MLYIIHMIRTQVYLPDELYQNIKLVAKKEKKSAAQIVRRALERELEEKKQTVGEAFLELSKIAAKGPKDLSTNHDKYLYEDL